MRFYDTATHTETHTESTTTIVSTDPSVSAFFDTLPDGYILTIVNSLPAIERVPRITDEELAAKQVEIDLAQYKIERNRILESVVVTTSNGNTFDGYESARLNMSNALQVAGYLNQTESYWKLADNTVVLIQLDELKEALALAIQKVGEIIL